MIEELSVLKQRIKILGQSESKRKGIAAVSSYLILFTILAMLFAGGPANSVCNAAGNPKEVRVGSEKDFPPYALVDENGQAAGFSVELIKAVTNAMGLSINVSTDSWDSVWNSLVSGQIDVLPLVAKLPERQRLVDFSLPHTETYDAFFVRKGDPVFSNIKDAQGLEIVVMRSDAAHQQLVQQNFRGKLILVDTIPAGLKLISSGRHNAFLCSKLIGTLIIKEHGITGLASGPTITDYKRVFSFAVKKGDTELLEKLNQGLLIVKTNGEYNRIYDKWLSFDDPWRKAQKYLLPAIIMVIAFAVITGFWLLMLQRLVRKRTRELAEKNEKLLHAYDDMEARVQKRTEELAQANQSLQVEIIERKQMAEALSESEVLWRLSIDNMLEAYALHEAIFDGIGRMVDYRFLEFNPAAQKVAGIAREEIVGRNAVELYPHIVKRGLMDQYAEVMATGIPAVIDDFYYAGDHLDKALDITCFRIDGRHFACVFRDITERKRAEEKIKASLLEKETMLKEIHHRVKNNLQVISSLLGLQSSFIKDEESREIFQDSQDRVKIMAQIHTMLYQSADLARVDFGSFIRDLAGRLQQSYGTAGSLIEIHTDIADVSLTIDTSIPCGLILNELVANALKYAFPAGAKGRIDIRMKREESRCVLTIRDNGIGFPAAIDFRKTQSLGLELVNLLVGQIDGTIDMRVDGGTTWTITFPMKDEREWGNG